VEHFFSTRLLFISLAPWGAVPSIRRYERQPEHERRNKVSDQTSRDYPTYSEPPHSGTKKQASEAASKAKEKATELGRSAAAKIDQKREPAAGTLDSAAATLHEKSESLPGGETAASMAHTAAGKLEATADYVREHDVKDMMSDVEEFVKSHPGQSLIAAAAVGFLVGRAFRDD
jgi:ElaB/YqjD/DUF883 family membrane-anchored ribosome-binding protein